MDGSIFLVEKMLLKAHCDGDQMLSTDYVCMAQQRFFAWHVRHCSTKQCIMHGRFLCVCDHDQYWLETRLVF